MTLQEHLLTCLIEESAEVIKATTKALRFGLLGSHPDYEQGQTNVEVLRYELHDLQAIVEILNDEVTDVLPFDRDIIEAKKRKVLKFVTHARANGTIS